jgi:hypothetical protein
MIEKDYNDFVNEMLEGVVFLSDEQLRKDTTNWKRSAANKGKKYNQETRRKLSKALKGKKQTKNHINNVRLSKLNKPLTEKHKRAISSAKKGISTITESQRVQISKRHKGKVMSKETRRKISNSMKGKNRKPMIDIRNKKIYEDYLDCKKKFGDIGLLAKLSKKYNLSKASICLIIKKYTSS